MSAVGDSAISRKDFNIILFPCQIKTLLRMRAFNLTIMSDQVLEVHRSPIAVLPPSDHSKLVMLSSLFVMLRPCVFLNINASSR